MIPLAVFGDPIAHSLSPRLHQLFAQQAGLTVDYRAILAPSATFAHQLREFFAAGGVGANITLPHKQTALSLADQATPRALRAGAANTLLYKNNSLLADNTDGEGLLTDLERLLGSIAGNRILILGAGGAVQGILQPILEASPASVVINNRTVERAQRLVEWFADERLRCYAETDERASFDIIINASAGGHGGQVANLRAEWFAEARLAYDLSYADAAAPFLQTARSLLNKSAQASDGLGMLVAQGAASFKLWTGVKADIEQALQALRV
ncbi:shikimate dehydrogenase [Aliidiomarina soli]|uniref:Shikimate dehydrogenase (NADP(+)) n=1 Tax=Aliidiomarina soli TaxID=1928574 RepID=A0A432WIN8_9GAMM|nr:shikimate dehydrogenase [Aliidiomarina soli]RUO33692.1 shikimate dehydrogenase [Aliidiomarina soli]